MRIAVFVIEMLVIIDKTSVMSSVYILGKVPVVEKYKYLGVYFDNRLDW